MYTGSKRFNQNQSFLKTRHVHTESSKLRNNEAFTIQKSTSCTLLEAKYGSRNKNPESYAARGKPRNTFELSKDDNGNVRSVLTSQRYRMLFL